MGEISVLKLCLFKETILSWKKGSPSYAKKGSPAFYVMSFVGDTKEVDFGDS